MANIQIQDVDYPNERQEGREFTVIVTVDNLSMTAPLGFYNPISKFDGECDSDRGVAGQTIDVTLEVNGEDADTKSVCAPYLGPVSGTINKGTDTAAFDVTVDTPGRIDMSVHAEAVGQDGESVMGPFAMQITEDPSAPNEGREGNNRGGPNPNNPVSSGGSGALGWVTRNPVKAGVLTIGGVVALSTATRTATDNIVPG